MKKIIPALFICLSFIACTKTNMEETEENETHKYIQNIKQQEPRFEIFNGKKEIRNWENISFEKKDLPVFSEGDKIYITTKSVENSTANPAIKISDRNWQAVFGGETEKASFVKEWQTYNLDSANQTCLYCLTEENAKMLNSSGLIFQGDAIMLTGITVDKTGSIIFQKEQNTENEGGKSLKEGARNNGFKMGTVISYDSLSDEQFKALVCADFNSITFANELKPYALLNQNASMKDPDGKPGLDFSHADEMLAFAKENHLKVRGHVLVWDAVMDQPWINWFFKEGYKSTGKLVDANTMKFRLQSYIEQVLTHCEQNFPGIVYCWDVVNEAVADSNAETKDNDKAMIRTSRGGAKNLYYETIGRDYVKISFEYARKVISKNKYNIKLFYNDYSTFNPNKCAAICSLIEEINHDKKLCDGIGMQSYIGGWGSNDKIRQDGCFKTQDLYNFKLALKKYSDMNLEIHITEASIRNFSNAEEDIEKHNIFYKNFMNLLKNTNTKENNVIKNVSIWGLINCNSLTQNHYSYTMNGPYCGLFEEKASDGTYKKRNVYKTVLEVLYKTN